MNEKTFYLFRHGQTDWNVERRCQGHTDIPLNQIGREQANELARFFREKEIFFDEIYSSDLSRAVSTAQAVLSSQPNSLELKTTFCLREGNLGEAEGLKIEQIKEKFGEERWNSFRYTSKNALDIDFPGGETRRESLSRVRGFVESLLISPPKVIGLSTHGGVLRSLLHSFLPEGHAPLDIPNCVVYRLDFQGQDWSVQGPLNEDFGSR